MDYSRITAAPLMPLGHGIYIITYLPGWSNPFSCVYILLKKLQLF